MLAAKNIVVPLTIAVLLSAHVAYADETVPDRQKSADPTGVADQTMWQFGEREKLCMEWTDGCRGCRRVDASTFSCSNVGIACLQKDVRCTLPISETPP